MVLSVRLVSMPFVGCERPSLGLSLLQAQLRRDGVECDTRYLTFALADMIGVETYDWIAHDLPYTAFVGEWVFARALYGPDREADRGYVRDVLVREWQRPREDVERIFRVRSACEAFIERCVEQEPWGSYGVIGFTSTFTQNLASLALAKRIKARYPHTRIVFGGANWEGEMGEALHAAFPFVDYVCGGEADATFPALVRALENGGSTASESLDDIAGIVLRRDGRSVSTGPAQPITDLDGCPVVDFDDYYHDWSSSAVAESIVPRPLLETSRGCWWGSKSHCTFCGLNGLTMSFRSKSADRVLQEIRGLTEHYGAKHIEVVDNILDMRYFKTLLPRLRDADLGVHLFYEVKANLRHEQVRLLRDAGVDTVQPGIESFSDHVLELMRKGTTALQNLQLLKWCKELGVRPEWNLLYGFPGESASDYEEMLPLIDAASFLDPPSGYGPVRLDRFSPYHVAPETYGMINLRPMEAYRYLYPQASADELMRISYYFEYDVEGMADPVTYADPVLQRIRWWRSEEERGNLWLLPHADGSLVVWDDRRLWPSRRVKLEGWRADVYRASDRTQSRASLARLLPDHVSVGELDQFLHLMVTIGFMVRTGDRLLALAVHRPPRDRTPATEVSAVETAP